MKVKQLVISNFGSFLGCHVVPMADMGLVFVRGVNEDEPRSPSNGAGKSTLFDALDWCLFGEHPRGDTTKSLMNDEAKKDLFVIAHLEDAGAGICVYRYRQVDKQSGVKLFVQDHSGWGNKTTLDAKQTQLEISKALGLDRTVFRASVYRSQGDTVSFADSTDSERKELLTSLIPELAEVDSLREVAKSKVQDVQKQRAALQGGMSQVHQELTALKATDWATAETAWSEARAQRHQNALQQHSIAASALKSASDAVAALTGLSQQLLALQQTPFVPTSVFQAELDASLSLKASAQSEVNALLARHKAATDELATLASLKEGPCSRCHQLVTGEHLKSELASLQQVVQDLVTKGKAARVALTAQEAVVAEARQHRDQEQQANAAGIAAYSQHVAQLKAQVQQLVQLNQQLPQLEQAAAAWAHQASMVAAEVWPGETQKQQVQDRIAQLESTLVSHQSQLVLLDRRETALAFWVNGLGAKGIKSVLLDSRIENLTKAANDWVQAVTSGTTWVRFETQTMNADGTLSEKLNLRIFRHNPDGSITERNFRSWSGGEKTRVALGADQGLAQLIADRASKSWELRILDEAFSRGLDGGGREAIFETIQKMTGSTVFVVDHSDIGGYFENELLVRIKGRRSQVFWKGSTCQVQPSPPSAFLPQCTA